MGKIVIGHADQIKAFAHESTKMLWLTASGTNPTTGWKNWFEPERTPNEFAFKQEQPDGIVADIVLPFVVKNTFHLPPGDHVIIREMDGGKEVLKTVPIVRVLCPVELATFAALTPAVVTTHALLTTSVAPTNYKLHLGSFDLPFGCATWTNPTRAKHFDIYLEVDVAGTQNVHDAVADCLKQSAIVTALALLLTPLGWAEGPAVFARLMQACLTSKLKNILNVSVTSDSHCA